MLCCYSFTLYHSISKDSHYILDLPLPSFVFVLPIFLNYPAESYLEGKCHEQSRPTSFDLKQLALVIEVDLLDYLGGLRHSYEIPGVNALVDQSNSLVFFLNPDACQYLLLVLQEESFLLVELVHVLLSLQG